MTLASAASVVDWSITLGNMIEIVVIAVGGIVFAVRMQGRVDLLALEVTHVKDQLKLMAQSFDQVSDVLTKVALQDQRIVNLERRLEELAHGEGFVYPLGLGTAKAKPK